MSEQRDLFKTVIPPCGRSSSPYCVVEQDGNVLLCDRCGCLVPTLTERSSDW
jgi:hypothetical protein